MPETAPGVIGRFMDAAAKRDYEAIGECFTEDASAEDEERTHRGRSQIRRWQQETRSRYCLPVFRDSDWRFRQSMMRPSPTTEIPA